MVGTEVLTHNPVLLVFINSTCDCLHYGRGCQNGEAPVGGKNEPSPGLTMVELAGFVYNIPRHPAQKGDGHQHPVYDVHPGSSCPLRRE